MNVAPPVSCFHRSCQPAPRPAATNSPARQRPPAPRAGPDATPNQPPISWWPPCIPLDTSQTLFPESSRNTPERRTQSFPAGSVAPAGRDSHRKFCCFCCGSPIAGEILGAGSGLVHPFRATAGGRTWRSARNGAGIRRPEPSGRFASGNGGPRYRGRRSRETGRADRGKLRRRAAMAACFRQRRPAD